MATDVITSIGAALNFMELRPTEPNYILVTQEDKNMTAIMVRKLRALRTFLLCSTILEGTELTMPKMQMHKLRVLRIIFCLNDNTSTTLGSFLVRIESAASRIYSGISFNWNSYFLKTRKLRKNLMCVESFEEEMDQWYTSFSDYLQQSSSPAMPDQVWDTFASIIENLDDFLVIRRACARVLVEPIEALKENITFLRNFIRFSTLLCADRHQEFCDLLTLIQPLAISSAHLTVHLFSATHYNAIEYFKHVIDSERKLSCEVMKSTVSALLLKIKPIDDPQLYKSYTLALEKIKNSRELYVSKLDLKDFTTFLLSTLWEMLQLGTALVVSLKDKLQVLYEGLRFLTIALEKKLDEFVGKIRDTAVTAAFDAGVIIFSLHQKDFAIDDGLRGFLENIQVIRSEGLDSKCNFPKTTILGFLEFLIDYLSEVRSSSGSDIPSYVSIIQEHLLFLKSFMEKLVELRNQQEELHQPVWSLVIEVAYKIELLIDQLVLGSVLDSFSASIQSIAEDMVIIKADFRKIFDKGTQEITVQKVTWTSTSQGPSRRSNPGADDVVGFEIERTSIIDRLERGSMRLQVAAIVGMPGSGKTTLAKMVYDDLTVNYHFHIRAWCSVSQVFNRRKIILELLKQIRPEVNFDSDTDVLREKLWQSLKGRRYLIFIDDIWERQAFDCLKESFPDDSTGSRLLLTSRNGEVAPEAILDDKPHFLRQLTESESLGLLQKKLFPGNDWPSSLYDFGLEVAEYCNGLPLTILIVAGILTTTSHEAWKGVLESLRSHIITTLTDECINSIELSYKHLPHHLKPCFLLFGAFPEDHLISVKKLIWLWIAEGFVRKNDSERLEDVATDYLNILIGRSLVMKASERSGGGVKECRIHDLLHDFCFRKANEELFLHVLKKEPLPVPELGNVRRLCVHSGAEHFKEAKLFCPHLRSVSFFDTTDKNKGLDMSFIFRISKLLRVLAMDQVGLAHFPREIGFLVQLRYLAIHVDYCVSPSIGNLTNLETLFLYPKCSDTKLPYTFWNLKKLRHLFSSNYLAGYIKLPANNPDSSCNLVDLDSVSTLYSDTPDILKKFPNIRRLKCRISDGPLNVMSFSYLSQLESLTLISNKLKATELILPESVKKLTFKFCELSGNFFSTIAKLPNLEVLKSIECDYTGNIWHVEEGEFSELKYLELISLDIVKWTTACDDQFPKLEKLVLVRCAKLVEIPDCLENIATLKTIDVGVWRPGRLASSVKKVGEYQKEMGNLALQGHVRIIGRGILEDVEDSDKEEEEEKSVRKKLLKRLLQC